MQLESPTSRRRRPRTVVLAFVAFVVFGFLIARGADPAKPGSDTDHTDSGIAFIKAGDWDKAIHELSEAIRVDSKYVRAYEYRGMAYFAKGDMDGALSDFNRVIQLDPTNEGVLFNRANVYRAKHKPDEALADFNQCLLLNPKNTNALLIRAWIYRSQNKFPEAISDCSAALRLNPQDIRGLQLRGYCHRMEGHFEQALRDDREVTRMDPENAEVFKEIAWILATCSDQSFRNGTNAVAAATKACELNHWKSWQYMDALAAAYAEAGDFQEAVKYEQRAMKLRGSQGNEYRQMRQRLFLYQDGKAYREVTKPSSS